MQIGIIGSGIAGLVAARLLGDSGHQVTVFEKQNVIGIDANSVDISVAGNGDSVRADVPSRMFNPNLWPSLWQLFENCKVDYVPVDTSQSFGQHAGPTWMTLQQANRPGLGLKGLISSRNRRLLGEAERLRREGSRDLETGLAPDLSLGDYLINGKYSAEFMNGFLFPTLSSTVFTCGYASLRDYPAVCVLETLQNLTANGSQLFRSAKGTRDVATRLLAENLEIRLASPIRVVRRVDQQVEIVSSDGQGCVFHHVVVATQANNALNLIEDLTDSEQLMLRSFTYETIPVYVHTDQSLMPARQNDWSTFNMLVADDELSAMCTVWLNRFHDHWQIEQPVFQTINAISTPDTLKIIHHCNLQRPVVNASSRKGLQTLAQLHGDPERRIWFCGAYASEGTPLLESGVRSAQNVAALIR